MNIKYELFQAQEINENHSEYIKWKNKNKFLDKSEITYRNFDWISYKKKYNDLNFGNDKKKYWFHWKNWGSNENRSMYENIEINSKNQWGCLDSHMNIINIAKKRNYEKILIFEDDVFFIKKFLRKLSYYNKMIKSKWNIIYFGGTQFDWKNIRIEKKSYIAKRTYGTFSYGIHKKMFEKILKKCEKMSKPIDNYLTEIQENTECLVLFPNLVASDLKDSNIVNRKNIKNLEKKLKWDINQYYIEKI